MVVSRRDITLLILGLLLGGSLTFVYGRLEWDYWRTPGNLYAEMPRLHAWAVRLMALGGPGRDGQMDYQVPEGMWVERGGTLKECFAQGPNDALISYDPISETLSAVYRCNIGDMIGELEVGLNDWERTGEILGGYKFRMLDAATAGPMQAHGVFGH